MQWPTPEQIAMCAISSVWFGYFSSSSSRYQYISDAHCIPVAVFAILAINGFIPEWVTMIFSATYMVRCSLRSHT